MGLAFILGLLVATAGTATAAKLITGKQIKDGSISSKDLNAAVRAQLARAGVAGPKGDPGAKGDPGIKGDTGPTAGTAAVEAWHEIGAVGEPAFENGWANYGNPDNVTGGFYKDPFGAVHLKGILSAGPNSVIFTLPPGYRPGKILVLPVWRGGAALLDIKPDGRVGMNYGAPGLTSLDGITFRAGE
jgi:hypothetical protein